MTVSAGTLTLTEFLTARLDEDEAAARCGWDEHGPWPTEARVLAEVEAKRRLVELHAPNGRECWWCGGDQGGTYPCENLRILALPYASHADYRAEWA